MKKIICFGDSITEMGTVIELRGYVVQLADRYVRRADVLPRGFSGYTTREARHILKMAVLDEQPDVVAMLFGTNDSVLPGQIQHVPLAEYKANLQYMASEIACLGAWLVLITPPPVWERKTKSRKMEHTAQYAQACFEVGLEMNLPVVDLFHKIQEEPNWEETCLLDGVHLSASGMDRLYEELVRALEQVQPLESLERLGVNGI
ncbi:MAG: SGNH/GDSL hydrolase family protein [Kiritimatiellae bacterium]|nr:SGNH/GDSL hydrolase family protein [Kiritimatiellia bacterium]